MFKIFTFYKSSRAFLGVLAKTQFENAKTQFEDAKTEIENLKSPSYCKFYAGHKILQYKKCKTQFKMFKMYKLIKKK